MLFKIVTTDNDEIFMECLDAIKKSLYNEKEYNTEDNIKSLHECLKFYETEDKDPLKICLDKLVEKICYRSFEKFYGESHGQSYGKYKVIGNKNMPFPFIDRYHKFFLQRKWNIPMGDFDSEESINNLFRLEEPEDNSTLLLNYSRNFGDYNHLLNVIAATARIMNYLKEINVIEEFLTSSYKARIVWREYAEIVKYDPQTQGLRIFMLMLAAYFHDIGKTVVKHRHGMEGAIIISEHSSQAWFQLNRIAKAHNIKEEFARTDLFLISDYLDYHDIFGKLSNGEAGYFQLEELIYKIKRFSLKNSLHQEQKNWSIRCLFDLWVLNIADIMVSVKDKYVRQTVWENKDESFKYIEEFSKNIAKFDTLRHDLGIANNLLEIINEHRHTDVLQKLSINSEINSERHTIERIRRLVCSSIRFTTDECGDKLKSINNIIPFINSACDISETSLAINIERSIIAISNLQDFCTRFSWISQMDSSLGFFKAICYRALFKINEEIEEKEEPKKSDKSGIKSNYCFRTMWIRDKFSDKLGEDPAFVKDLNKLQSQYFVENYVSVVIQIIAHLLYREEGIERIKNIEFNDAVGRLTDEKLDSILSLKGPYHSKRSIQFVLKTVFVY